MREEGDRVSVGQILGVILDFFLSPRNWYNIKSFNGNQNGVCLASFPEGLRGMAGPDYIALCNFVLRVECYDFLNYFPTCYMLLATCRVVDKVW